MSITIPKLHIVIPVYNEDKNVIDIVKQIIIIKTIISVINKPNKKNIFTSINQTVI